jgi:DNA primase
VDAFQFGKLRARARAVPIEREIERRKIKLKRVGTAEQVGPCPVCGGDDRFSINTKKQCFNCRVCGVGGDVITLVQHLDEVDFKTACKTLAGKQSPKRSRRNGKDREADGKDREASSAAESMHGAKEVVRGGWSYHDAGGALVFVVERREYQHLNGNYVLKDGKRKKTFRQRRPHPNRPGKWIWNVTGIAPLLYRLPELTAAIAADQPVLVVEGEAKADLLAEWGIAATCNAGGSKSWKPEHAAFLKDADVYLLPDNDEAGWHHLHTVGESLAGIAKRVRVVVLPNLPDTGDIIDWASAGGTPEKLSELMNSAPDWTPPVAADPEKEKEEAARIENELIEALAAKSGLDFARERKKLAKDLGVTAADIDSEVKAHRDKTAPLYGHWIVEPWPEPPKATHYCATLLCGCADILFARTTTLSPLRCG